MVARALAEKAELLSLSGERSETLALGEAMIARAGDEGDPKQLALLARGLGAKGMARVGEGRYEEALMVFDEHAKHCENAADGAVRAERRQRGRGPCIPGGGGLRFNGIPSVIERTLADLPVAPVRAFESLYEADRQATAVAGEVVATLIAHPATVPRVGS